MNRIKVYTVLGLLLASTAGFAGNPDRAGSSSGAQVLINPWAKSSGLANASSASLTGIEATFFNPAGLALTKKTEIVFVNTNYLSGSNTSVNAIGFSQKVGESGVIGLALVATSFGDIEITKDELPEGGIGYYTPGFANLGLSYSKTFTNSIQGGFTFKVISERISNVNATGFALDGGVRYVTGKHDNLRLGIALKNVGPPMRYRGDGLGFQTDIPGNTGPVNLTMNQKADQYEQNALVNIGAAYDFILTPDMHMLTLHGNFTSNSFKKDQFSGGLEYGFKKRFIVRAGYMAEGKDDLDYETNVWTGLAAGASVVVPFGKNPSSLSFDYSYRDTNPFNGIHSVGVRLNL